MNPFLMVPRASFDFCSNCLNCLGALFFGPSGGKSDALNPFLLVPRSTFDFWLKLLKLPRRSFFGPSGGKSDALNPFLMVPRSSFDLFGKMILSYLHYFITSYLIIASFRSAASAVRPLQYGVFCPTHPPHSYRQLPGLR